MLFLKVSLYYFTIKYFSIQLLSIIIISLCMPMYSLICLQKGYVVIDLIEWC